MIVTTVAGQRDCHGCADGQASAATFKWPNNVCVDPVRKRVLITDEEFSCIRAWEWETDRVVTVVGAADQTGWSDGTCQSARFDSPVDVAIDPTDAAGGIFVVDSGNHRIIHVDERVNTVCTVIGSSVGMQGFADGRGTAARLACPDALAFNSRGIAFLADTRNYRIRQGTRAIVQGSSERAFDITTVAGNGEDQDEDGPLLAASFKLPMDLIVDARRDRVLYVPGSGCLRKIDLDACSAIRSLLPFGPIDCDGLVRSTVTDVLCCLLSRVYACCRVCVPVVACVQGWCRLFGSPASRTSIRLPSPSIRVRVCSSSPPPRPKMAAPCTPSIRTVSPRTWCREPTECASTRAVCVVACVVAWLQMVDGGWLPARATPAMPTAQALRHCSICPSEWRCHRTDLRLWSLTSTITVFAALLDGSRERCVLSSLP
jgi:hypothetical protein